MRTPWLSREAGSLINRSVTTHHPRFWHPRTGCTALLLLSTTTELFIINLVPQHDPQSDPELACHRYTRFPQTFLNQLAAIESFQLRITAYRVTTRLIPQKAQQRATLFCYFTEPLSSSTGAFPRDKPYITGERFAIREPPRITQEYLGRQCRHGPHSGMRHEPLRVGTLVSLLGNLLGQVLDFLFHLLVHGLQCAPSIRGMGRQWQECDLGLPVVAPQTRTSP